MLRQPAFLLNDSLPCPTSSASSRVKKFLFPSSARLAYGSHKRLDPLRALHRMAVKGFKDEPRLGRRHSPPRVMVGGPIGTRPARALSSSVATMAPLLPFGFSWNPLTPTEPSSTTRSSRNLSETHGAGRIPTHPIGRSSRSRITAPLSQSPSPASTRTAYRSRRITRPTRSVPVAPLPNLCRTRWDRTTGLVLMADANRGYSVEPPLHWTSHSHGIQRYGATSHRG